MYSNNDPELKLDLKGHEKPITCLRFHPKKNVIITGSEDANVIIWNIDSPEIKSYKFTWHKDSVTDVDYSSTGKHFVTSSADRSICIWEPKLLGRTTELGRHAKAVTSVNFSYNNRAILSASHDKCLKLWDVHQERFLHALIGHNHWVNCGRFNCDAKVAVSCSEDKTVKVWDVANHLCIHTFRCKSAANNIAVFGNYIACAMQSGSVRIFNIQSNKMVQHYKLAQNICSLAWYPSGEFLLVGSSDGKVRLLDTIEGRPLYNIGVSAQSSPVGSVDFSSTGDHFACAGKERKIFVWKTNIDDRSTRSTPD